MLNFKFFLKILRVLFNITLNIIYKKLYISKQNLIYISTKKN